MIKVLVVEDSPVVQELLTHILNSDPELKVIGTACNGKEALEFLTGKKPDVITMDIHMPVMDGFEATSSIMANNPVPIIIVSASWEPAEVEKTFQAIEAGALTCIEKPLGLGHPDYEKVSKNLIETVKVMAGVKLVRRWSKAKPTQTVPQSQGKKALFKLPEDLRVVAIGASTGGPPALQELFSGFPDDFAVPILIVQHISHGFLPGLVEWLGQSIKLTVSIASDNESLFPGTIYFAPDGKQMGVDIKGRIKLSDQKTENSLCPSVSYLFRSVSETYGPKAIGVLLTGMGKDGAEELKLMRDCGAITFAQDRETSVVHGMPGEAIKLGAAMYVLSPNGIAEMIKDMVNNTTQVLQRGDINGE